MNKNIVLTLLRSYCSYEDSWLVGRCTLVPSTRRPRTRLLHPQSPLSASRPTFQTGRAPTHGRPPVLQPLRLRAAPPPRLAPLRGPCAPASLRAARSPAASCARHTISSVTVVAGGAGVCDFSRHHAEAARYHCRVTPRTVDVPCAAQLTEMPAPRATRGSVDGANGLGRSPSSRGRCLTWASLLSAGARTRWLSAHTCARPRQSRGPP